MVLLCLFLCLFSQRRVREAIRFTLYFVVIGRRGRREKKIPRKEIPRKEMIYTKDRDVYLTPTEGLVERKKRGK
jgi:hypothetical protein